MPLVVSIIQNLNSAHPHQENSMFPHPRLRSGAQEELQLLQKSCSMCNVVRCLFNSPQNLSLPAGGGYDPAGREDASNLSELFH